MKLEKNVHLADVIRRQPWPEKEIDNQWVLARPVPYFGIIDRLKTAWKVLIGKYDALMWWKQ